MSKPLRILIVHETVSDSWKKDAGTCLTFVGLIGLGWLIDSGPMQVVGALLGMVLLVSKAIRSKGHCEEMTVAQAAVEIDRLLKSAPSKEGE